jgi:dihydroorotate dehydrogenase
MVRVYRLVFAVLARINPETAHHLGMAVIRLCGLPGVRQVVRRFTKPADREAVSTMGLEFASPLGVAAGFDKNAHGVLGLWALGFDHVEVGTVTPKPQPGNPQPRLFRLLGDRALINRMGFNNDGMVAVKRRLAKIRRRAPRPVVGVNIGKNRDTDVANAVDDYRTLAAHFADVADYLVINVSSPNTPGLRDLGHATQLVPLVEAVVAAASDVPVLVKLSPDATDAELTAVIEKLATLPIAGIITTNTTTNRSNLVTSALEVEAMGDGGLSGHPLAARSQEVTHLARQLLPETMMVVSVGGVETGWDVHRRQLAGATLVQLYTAFVYQGPGVARAIHRQLATITF